MKTALAIYVTESYLPYKTILLLCLLCSLALSACGPAPTPTPTPTLIPIPVPTIIPAHPCKLEPGETIPLVAMGVPGGGIVFIAGAPAQV